MGRQPHPLPGRGKMWLGCAGLLPDQHLRNQDLHPSVLPPNGSGHIQPTLALRDLGSAGISRGLLPLDIFGLLLHLPTAERLLAILQLRL